MSPPAPLTVTLAGLAAAELVRAEYPDCIHDADDGRSRTVTLSGDTPSYCLDAIGQIARRSFDERDERYGQVELTPGERARVDFSETNVFHARACKAIAEHHGVLEWLDYYDTTLTTDEHVDVFTRAGGGAGTMRMVATEQW